MVVSQYADLPVACDFTHHMYYIQYHTLWLCRRGSASVLYGWQTCLAQCCWIFAGENSGELSSPTVLPD